MSGKGRDTAWRVKEGQDGQQCKGHEEKHPSCLHTHRLEKIAGESESPQEGKCFTYSRKQKESSEQDRVLRILLLMEHELVRAQWKIWDH